jgi:hypothetical protein
VREGGALARPGIGGHGLRPMSGSAHVGVLGGDREREGGREEVGGWAGLGYGPHPSVKRGEWERLAGGPGRNLNKFKIVQNCPNSIQSKTDPPVL